MYGYGYRMFYNTLIMMFNSGTFRILEQNENKRITESGDYLITEEDA
jgi:hypothetical protein